MDFKFKIDKINDKESENYFNLYNQGSDLSFSSEISLGEGGFGKTWKASIEKNEFAIKIFNESSIVTYENEFQALKALGGAEGHSPKVFAYGKVYFPEKKDPLPAIVMEYMRGMPLQTRVESQNGSENSSCLDLLAGGNGLLLGSEQVLSIVQQAALASDACFQRGANGSLGVHRDLSPDNIIVEVDKDHRAVRKVSFVDWGSSPKAKGLITPAHAARFGKVLFSSPEIFFGNHSSNRTDITVDIYSIGLLAFWLRTRKYPLATELKPWGEASCIETNDFSKIDKIRRDYKVDLVEWIKQSGGKVTWWDKKLSTLIAECTQYEPEKRLQMPSELARRADVVQKLIEDIHKVSTSDDEIRSVADEVSLEVKIVGHRADDSWNLKYTKGMEEELEEVYNRLVAKAEKVTVPKASRVTPLPVSSRALLGKMLPRLGSIFHGVKRLRRLGLPLYGLLVLVTLAVILADRVIVTNQLMHMVSISICVFVALLSVALFTLSLRHPNDGRRLGYRFGRITCGIVCALGIFYGLSGIIGMADGQWYAQAGDELVNRAQYLAGDERKDKLSQALGYIQQSAGKGNGDGLALLAKRYYSGDAIEQNYSKAFDLAEQSTDKGSAIGMATLAACFYRGDGVERNYDRAFELASKSADKGDKRGIFCLAVCYYNGHVPSSSDRGGEAENKKEAFSLFTKAAEQGYAPAEYDAGRCLRFGWGTEQSDEHDKQAFQYFQRACDKNYVPAMALLGDCYYWGKGVDKNYGRAREWYERSYAGGDGYGTYCLAYCYYFGNSVVERDPNKAFELSKVSADEGNNDGKYLLGCCYLYGRGTQKNEEEAVKIFKELDDANNGSGEAELGDCYYYGNSVVKRDRKKAAQLYEESMDHGSLYGEARYGFYLFYNYGDDKQKDREEAFSHFLAAADGGSSYGLGWVAYCSFYGYGTEQDYDRALKYARRAADDNSWLGQRMLGICYYFGRGGVAVNRDEACKLFESASENGDNAATVWCGQCLLDKVNADDTKEAKKRFEQVRGKGKDVSCYGEATAWLAYCYIYRYRGLGMDEVAAENEAVNLLNEIPENQRSGFVCEMLGECYFYGYGGIERNDRAAVDLFNRALGEDKFTDEHGSAFYYLGKAYHGGFGVARDDNRAKEMLRMAVLFGGDRYGYDEYVGQQATKTLFEWYGLEVAEDGTLQQKN